MKGQLEGLGDEVREAPSVFRKSAGAGCPEDCSQASQWCEKPSVGDAQDDWEPLTKPQERVWLHFPSAFRGLQGYHISWEKPTWNLPAGVLKGEVPTLTDLTDKGDGLVLLVRGLQPWSR